MSWNPAAGFFFAPYTPPTLEERVKAYARVVWDYTRRNRDDPFERLAPSWHRAQRPEVGLLPSERDCIRLAKHSPSYELFEARLLLIVCGVSQEP